MVGRRAVEQVTQEVETLVDLVRVGVKVAHELGGSPIGLLVDFQVSDLALRRSLVAQQVGEEHSDQIMLLDELRDGLGSVLTVAQ